MTDVFGTEISPISRDARLRAAAYAGVLAAYWAAAGRDPLTPLQLVLFAAAGAWSLGFEHRFRKPFFSSPAKIGLIAVGSAIFVAFLTGNLRGTGDHFAGSISKFLFWNAIVFVLSRNKSEYDLWTLAIIELSLFMIAGAFVQPPEFLPLLVGAAGCFLYVFQRLAVLRCGPSGEAERGGLGLLVWTLLLSLEIGALIFVAFPRDTFRGHRFAGPGTRKPGAPEGEPVATHGARSGVPLDAEFMTLTSLERLKIDPRPVLRVRITDATDPQSGPVPPSETPYLRGAILDTYGNGRWERRFRKEERRDEDDRRIDGWTTLDRRPAPGRLIARQRIVTTGLSGDLSFCLPEPLRVEWKEARYDPEGIVFFAQPPREKVEYQIDSVLPLGEAGQLAGTEVEDSPGRYLQVPEGLTDLRRLARTLTEGLDGRVHARAARLRDHLMRDGGFAYRLDPFVPAEGRDPVEHFLFSRKQGFCTHFATALALLCRAAGVPARVATGFQLHSPQEDGSFLVKSSDAHAWVEVWFGPGWGWRAFDATPESGRGPGVPPPGDPVATLEKGRKPEEPFGPAGRWDRFVVEFDPALQGEALRDAARAVAMALSAAGRFLAAPRVAGAIAAAALLAGIVYLLLPRRQRNRLRQIAARFREPTRVNFYRDLLWALSLRGCRKPASMTGLEFAREATARLGDAGIGFVTEKFYQARYRGTPPTPDELRRIDEVIARLLKPAQGIPGHP